MVDTQKRVCPNCDKLTTEKYCEECSFPTIVYVSPEEDIDPLIGQTFQQDKYEIKALLGRGGMGSVYKAIQRSINRIVAIKLLKPEFTENIEMVKRFHREAMAASRLSHPHIVEIYDFGEADDGSCFIVMEFLEGMSLTDLLEREHPLDHQRIVLISIQVAKALLEAHGSGIVHRDLKPDNIFIKRVVGEGDFTKILDFGIAKFTQKDSGQSNLTRTGMIMGSPHYMSPEQALGKRLDYRADIYSFGVIMYEMITGTAPFDAENPMGILMKHIKQPVPPIHSSRPDVPARLEELVYSMLEKDREQRIGTIESILKELQVIQAEIMLGGSAVPSGARPMPRRGELVDEGDQVDPRRASRARSMSGGGTNDSNSSIEEAMPRRSGGLVWALVGVVVLAALLAGGYFMYPMLFGDATNDVKADPPAHIAKANGEGASSDATNAAASGGATNGTAVSGSKDTKDIVEVGAPAVADVVTPKQEATDVVTPKTDAKVTPEIVAAAVHETVTPAEVHKEVAVVTYKLTLAVKPNGTAIYNGDEKLGSSPLEMDVPADTELNLKFIRNGYHIKTVRITMDKDVTYKTYLKKRKKTTKSSSGGSSKTNKKDNTKDTKKDNGKKVPAVERL